MKNPKLAIIGAGAMGGAIAQGIQVSGFLPKTHLIVSNPSQEKIKHFGYAGAKITSDNRMAVGAADIVILAVKPWLVQHVLEECRDLFTPDKILVSVAAGIAGSQLVEWTDGVPQICIAIPNIAIAYRSSMTFITSVNATDETTQRVADIFDEMGRICICDEAHLQVGMALASCGIAYAFRYIRAASEGGVELGFKAWQAQDIVMQTLRGAVTLLEADGMHPEEAIDRVTTPGGLTIKGLNAMERNGFTTAVIEGLKACLGR